MHIFIGGKYINSAPENIEGLDFLCNPGLNSRDLYIDLGGFSTQILVPEKEILEVKNFFVDIGTARFPKSVRSCKIGDKKFLIGQDAIDYAKLNNITIEPIFQNKEFCFSVLSDVNTFSFLENILNDIDPSSFDRVVINNQTATTKLFLKNYFKDKEIIYIDDTIAQLNSQIPVTQGVTGIIFDIGYQSVNCLFLLQGLAFHKKTIYKGAKQIHESISSTGSIDIGLINKEINREIDISLDDGANMLYRYFYENFFNEIFTDYLKELKASGALDLVKSSFPVYLVGGILDFSHVDELVKEVLIKAAKNYNKELDISVINTGYSSLLKGLCSRRI